MGLNNVQKSYVAGFLVSLGFFGPIAIPFFIDWIGVDYKQIFLLQAWFVMWVFILEIPTGIVADKFGRKISLSLGCLFFAADLFVFGFSRSFPVFFLSEFFGALGVALISGADTAFIYDSIKNKKEGKKYLSRYQAAGTLGMVVAFPLGSLIAGSQLLPYPGSLAIPFLLSGLCALLAALVFISVDEPKRHFRRGHFLTDGIKGMKLLWNNKPLRAFAINSILISSVTFFIFWFYQPLAGQAGIPLAIYGFIAGGYNLIAALLLIKVNELENFFGMKNILFYTAIMPALLFIALAFFKSAYFVIPAIFVIAISKLLRYPILSDFMNQHIRSRRRATVISCISALERLCIFALYLILGVLADISLNYALLFLGIMALVFAVFTRIEDSHITN